MTPMATLMNRAPEGKRLSQIDSIVVSPDAQLVMLQVRPSDLAFRETTRVTMTMARKISWIIFDLFAVSSVE
eukprot:scaffold1850_cov194-Pinguiococcus_pyrenoidosus.AAC.62